MPEIIFLPLTFLFGLIFGSFANVCIYRLPKAKPFVWGRSFCPKCKKLINWFDNIPLISYLNLNSKCRKCKKAISKQYFVIELISGLSFLFIFMTSYSLLAQIILSFLFWESCANIINGKQRNNIIIFFIFLFLVYN